MSEAKLRFRVLISLAACLWSAQAFAQDSQEAIQVTVRGSAVTVYADVYENPSPFTLPTADTILAVPGFTETGKSWQPFVEALFDHPLLKFGIERVITLDFPGHGASPKAPAGAPFNRFGDLFIEDNADILIQVLTALKSRGLAVEVVMGHSMGGLEIQSAQEKLLAQNSSLAKRGVFRAILIASVPNAGVAWSVPPSSSPPTVTEPTLGTYIVLSPATAQAGGFLKASSLIPPAVPTILCYDGFGPPCIGGVPPEFVGQEPLFIGAQLVGSDLPPPFPPIPDRPFARQGAFHPIHGTLLTVIGFQEDALTPASVQLPLYQYLVGSSTRFLYRLVDTPDSVHAMQILNPEGLLGDLDQVFLLF
jgi:pimeloyl-ACP methyl ester carboxylesterase